WPTDTPPTGWIAMVGQTISQSVYPELYAIYGATLPDMRGYFIRGWAGSQTAIDSGRTLLTKETGTGLAMQLGGFTGYNGIDADNAETGNLHSSYAVYEATATQVSTGVTYKKIRPDNIAFNYIVRAA
ncbi:phage tail protein, partial [Martelella alba]